VEFGNSPYQPILDRYIQGEDVPQAYVQHVWRDATTSRRAIVVLGWADDLNRLSKA